MPIEFHSPKLLIVDYYDSLISDIDIYTEQLLEKYTENDLLPNEIKSDELLIKLPTYHDSDFENKEFFEIESMVDPYKEFYSFEKKQTNLTPESTKIRDYLNLVRSKSIEEINKVKEENLSRYDLNKDKYKYKLDELNAYIVEDMKRELFKDRYCFQLRIDRLFAERISIPFQLITIFTDFYIDSDKIPLSLIEIAIENYYSNAYLDENTILNHLVSKYITGLIYTQLYGNEVIFIDKSNLLNIDRIEYIENYNEKSGMNSIGLLLSISSDLSNIKSLGIYASLRSKEVFTGLNVLKNLEYLYMSNTSIDLEEFNGLEKLIKLELRNCNISKSNDNDNIGTNKLTMLKLDKCELNSLDSTFLSVLPNLQIIEIISPTFKINLDKLKSVKIVILKDVEDFYALENLGNNLSGLRISCEFPMNQMQQIDEFFKRHQFQNITDLWLNIGFEFNPNWIHSIRCLRKLSLSGCYSRDNLDFLRWKNLSKLEYLCLRSGSISLFKKRTVFSKLNRLKYLDLSLNCVQIGKDESFDDDDENSGRFRIFGCFRKDGGRRWRKNVFQGLESLTTLDLSQNGVDNIDPDVFKKTPVLAHLKLQWNRCKLETNTFCHLKHLNKIELNEYDLDQIDSSVLDGIRRSNIEIVNDHDIFY